MSAERGGPRGALLAGLVIAQVLAVANANLVAVALPPLAADLGLGATAQQWVVDAYVLVFASLLVAAGALGDRYGHRRTLLLGLLAFAAGSLACAVAGGSGTLIAARALQGTGPALVLPASLAIVAAAYPDPASRARAIGWWGTGSGLGVALGPVLGGVLVTGLDWRWAFALNGVAALALLAWLGRAAPRVPPVATGHVDWLGAVTVVGGVAGLVFAIVEGPERGWTAPEVLAGVVAAVVLLVVFALVEARHPRPLVPLHVLRVRALAAANLGGAAVMFAILALTVLVSHLLQDLQGRSALETGLVLLPLGAGVAVFAPLSGRLTARVPARAMFLLGMVTVTVGVAWLALIGGATTVGGLAGPLLLCGVGTGIAFPPMTSTAVGAVPRERSGTASALHNASRQLGATLGVAVLGALVLGQPDVDAAAAGIGTAMTIAAGVLAAATAGVAVLAPR